MATIKSINCLILRRRQCETER